MFIRLMRFLLESLVSRSFLVLLGTLLIFFFFHRSFDGVRFQYSQKFAIFFFSLRSNSFLIWQFSCFYYFFPFSFSLWARHIFLYQIPFLYPGGIFLLFVSDFPILFHFLPTAWCYPYNVIKLFLLFCKFGAPTGLPKYLTEGHHCYHK